MKMKLKLIVGIFLLSFYNLILAQEFTQTVKGRVIDKVNQMPLPGATVVVVGSNPVVAAVSDENGKYKLARLPLGRVSLQVSYVGYQPSGANNILLSSGKEFIIDFELEEKVTQVDEVVVKANKVKGAAANEMAVISSRSFTVEETEKYAGSRGDVARMASNFAGVSSANDSRNDIIIRGNSPSGLLWRLDDIEIPNPNHFAENGTTGGPVGMLNNNVLRNSDFYTGAFPAEYGNAMSGVFDLKMRPGNNEKHERLFQVGFNGFEVGLEGPIKRNSSSYLINYRFSTLDLMSKMGFDFGTSGIPKYQDCTFKINIPGDKSLLSIVGVGGASKISMFAENNKGEDMYNQNFQNLYNGSEMAALGVTYTRFINSKTNVKFIVSGLYQNGHTEIDTVDTDFKNPERVVTHGVKEYRNSYNIITGTKFNSRLSSKAGIGFDAMGYDLRTFSWETDSNRMLKRTDGNKTLFEGPILSQVYYEVNYKLSDNFSVVPGLHATYFSLNNEFVLEPRIGASWQYAENRKINIGYGKHSRTHALSTYYLVSVDRNTGKELLSNLDLKMTKSNQFVIGHDWNISKDLRLKTEAYYQTLYDVPVENRATYFSYLNSGSFWGVEAEDSLENEGVGQNYGLEITLEKFLSNGFYGLFTVSLFDSKYKGSDKVERNTAYNGNYITNLLFGYEYRFNQRASLNFDIRLSYAGGKPRLPIDLEKSMNTGNTEYDYSKAYESKLDDFFKTDFKVSYRLNSARISQEWQIYIENITDHQNPLYEYYSRADKAAKIIPQMGFFPMMNYRLYF